MVVMATIPITDTGTHIHVTGMATGNIPVTVTATATIIQVTGMGTDTIRAGGIATRGGLGDATGISCTLCDQSEKGPLPKATPIL
jgi:hypothetical protein